MSKDAYIHKLLPGSPGGPLLFVFHGTGGDENQLVSLGRELLPSATIVSPRGDVSEHGAGRFFRRTGEGVYDMDDLARATGKMAGFMRMFFILRRKPVSTSRGPMRSRMVVAGLMAETTVFARRVSPL